MPACEVHKDDPNISCGDCYSNEELQAELEKLNSFKLPSSPGTKSKPRRTDDKPKKGRTSWMDELL